MKFPEIDPVMADFGPWEIFGTSLGPIELRWYSTMYVIGLLAMYLFLRYASKKQRLKLTTEQIENLMVYGLIGMILGARSTYVFVYNFSYYFNHPGEIFAVSKGGLSFHGAFIGVALAILIYAKRNKTSFLTICDHVATLASFGLGLGRIGNFINGELWGRVTDHPWGMVFPDGGPLPRHPSQLYESFFEGWVLLGIMLFIYARFKLKPGITSGIFICFYSFFRYLIEYFREPDQQLGLFMGHFSMGQILCMIMFAFGVGVIMVCRKLPARS